MFDDILKKLIFDVVVGAVLSSIVSAVPILGLPVISTIVTSLLMKVAWMLFEQTSRLINFQIIEWKDEATQRAYEAAVADLKSLHDDPMADEESIENAKQKFKDTLRDLIKLSPK